MAEEGSQMAGAIQSTFSPDQLAAALTSRKLRVQVRESSHYEGGRYIAVYEGATEFTLEKIPGEYLARGDASSVEQMHDAVSCVSAALTTLDIRHVFEIYDENSHLVRYEHHRWPPINSM